jgi:ATP-dependent exoDNAse (exonuclease V) alpha subunit
MKWNTGQQRAIDLFQRWFENEAYDRPFLLQGYAGTGKTTLLKHLQHLVPNGVAYCSPTGKAARVLSKKTEKDATTIHKLLYRPLTNELNELQKQLGELVSVGEEDPRIQEIEDRIRTLEQSELSFVKKENLEFNASVIVVDEASMVDKYVAKDLFDLNRPLVLVGDPFQLPPVKSAAGWASLEPDVVLDKIERQQGDETFGIIQAATDVRTGSFLGVGLRDGPGFKVHRSQTLGWDAFSDADIVLCGTNDLRRKLNKGVRKYRGYTDPLPQVGEKIISLANDDNTGIRNGEIFTVLGVTDVRHRAVYLHIQDDTGTEYNVRTWGPLYENDAETDLVPNGFLRMTFAYAITVHKSQGSEWDRVILCDSWPGQRYRNWLYTGLTRAAKHCDFIKAT